MTPTLASTSRRTGSTHDSPDPRPAPARVSLFGIPRMRMTAGLVVKYSFDYVLAALMVVLCAPMFLMIALAIKSNSRGPVLFVQKRVGKNGRVFNFYKF